MPRAASTAKKTNRIAAALSPWASSYQLAVERPLAHPFGDQAHDHAGGDGDEQGEPEEHDLGWRLQSHARLAQVGTRQVGAREVGPTQIRLMEYGTGEVGVAEIGGARVGPAEVGTSQLLSSERSFAKLPANEGAWA